MRYRDMQVLEGLVEADELEQAKALQRTINAGSWGLQGSYGRAMMSAIAAGRAMLGKTGHRDYYGSYVPSGSYVPARDEVEPGTMGSFEYVAEAMGESYAEALAAEP